MARCGGNDYITEQYRDLRKELRTRGISIQPEYRADLESADGYENLRKRYFGKVRIGQNGTAADFLARDLLERYYDTPQENPTFADRQAKKLEETRARDREEFEARLYRNRKQTEARIKQIQKQHQEQDRKRIEKQNASRRRETIRRHASRLGRMLLTPTDKQHVPEELRGTALKFVQSLNLKSGFGRDLFGKRIPAELGAEQGAAPTKRSEAARVLQEKYKALAETSAFTIDPDMDSYLDELAGMADTPLAKLGKGELDTIRGLAAACRPRSRGPLICRLRCMPCSPACRGWYSMKTGGHGRSGCPCYSARR